jgi:hypothetical protein
MDIIQCLIDENMMRHEKLEGGVAKAVTGYVKVAYCISRHTPVRTMIPTGKSGEQIQWKFRISNRKQGIERACSVNME